MKRHQEVLEKLLSVVEKEWMIVLKKCKEHIKHRIQQKTKFGAHNEQNLGEDAYGYYLKTAIEKLYSGDWDWKFEEYTLLEQLIRIVDSLISETVRKFKTKKAQSLQIEYKEDLSYAEEVLVFTEEDAIQLEKKSNDRIKLIEVAINGDEDLEFLFLYILESKSYKEICIELDWPKSKLYKVVEKLRKKINSIDQI
jgi:hypothetical protein